MDIKTFFSFTLLLFSLIRCEANNKILVERYERWDHPVIKVLKKYGITLYKVSYSLDGTCPTFYAKFKYSPDTRAPDANSFDKVYFEVLKANSYFPYAFVDNEDDMRINVGWDSRNKNIMAISFGKASSTSTCNGRSSKR